MKVLIISPGKKHDTTVAEGIAEYSKRLSVRLPIEWAFPGIGTKEEEGAAILKLIKKEDIVVLLDERGKDVDTPGFATMLEKQMQSGTKRFVFIVGGAFGISAEVAARANSTLKLSDLVFPHMIVRFILTEQLYRAVSIIDGGKYHHA